MFVDGLEVRRTLKLSCDEALAANGGEVSVRSYSYLCEIPTSMALCGSPSAISWLNVSQHTEQTGLSGKNPQAFGDAIAEATSLL